MAVLEEEGEEGEEGVEEAEEEEGFEEPVEELWLQVPEKQRSGLGCLWALVASSWERQGRKRKRRVQQHPRLTGVY